ncbi:MAG: type II toxin-antitoxin system Phd/YefM family antitoxin [Anaerolineae bacterium]|nr:type II toxin-antitoxin system Phd/YefM family antitoxin [Anaerolineae bacterium]
MGKAKARFAKVLNRAAHGKERFIVERRGKAVAAIVSIEDLEQLEIPTEKAMRETAVTYLVRPVVATPPERGLYTESGEIDREFIRSEIAAGRMHPAMAMFGVWSDQPEWDDIVEEIYENRRQQGSREISLP